jgi:hypothetical protein
VTYLRRFSTRKTWYLANDIKPKGTVFHSYRRKRFVRAIRYIHSLIEVLEGNEGVIVIIVNHVCVYYVLNRCLRTSRNFYAKTKLVLHIDSHLVQHFQKSSFGREYAQTFEHALAQEDTRFVIGVLHESYTRTKHANITYQVLFFPGFRLSKN